MHTPTVPCSDPVVSPCTDPTEGGGPYLSSTRARAHTHTHNTDTDGFSFTTYTRHLQKGIIGSFFFVKHGVLSC